MSSPSSLLIQYVNDVALVTFNQTTLIETRDIEHIREELYDMVDKRAQRRMILDLGKVQLLSSSALGVLIPLRDKVAKLKRGELVLCGVRPEIRRVFKITKLEKRFCFCKTEAEALAKMGLSMPA